MVKAIVGAGVAVLVVWLCVWLSQYDADRAPVIPAETMLREVRR